MHSLNWPICLCILLYNSNSRVDALHTLKIDLDGTKQTLVIHKGEIPFDVVRKFGYEHQLWSEERQQILDHLCGDFGLECKTTHVPSISDYLYQGGISFGKGHKGAGSAGPDAHNEMIHQQLETWHRNRFHDRLNQFKVGDKIPVSVPSSIWSDSEPYVSRLTSISGMEIYVINNAVPKQIASEWDLELRHATFKRTESDNKFANTNKINAWVAEFSVAKLFLLKSEIYWRMQEIVDALFPLENFKPNRVYCNSCHYGDIYFTHRDYAANDRKHVSVIYYANAEWPHEWQGETMFYDHQDDTDALIAVTPRPGRIAVFRGSIPHRSAAPSRLCLGPRYTWVFKFTSSSRVKSGGGRVDL